MARANEKDKCLSHLHPSIISPFVKVYLQDRGLAVCCLHQSFICISKFGDVSKCVLQKVHVG